VRGALDKAMHDIRDMCRGLALPDIDGMPLGRVVQRAIQGHSDLTGTEVALEDTASPAMPLDHSQLICGYRFVQEGLTKAATRPVVISRSGGSAAFRKSVHAWTPC
jgi:signal transduction histidine kinase